MAYQCHLQVGVPQTNVQDDKVMSKRLRCHFLSINAEYALVMYITSFEMASAVESLISSRLESEVGIAGCHVIASVK